MLGPDGLTQAERNAGKPPLDLITVKDVYGDSHRVSQSALDDPKRKMLRRFNAKGEPIEGSLLARGNIDTDGTGVTATYADDPIIGGGRTSDKPLATEGAVKAAIRKRGQKVEDFDIREVDSGYLAVRKTPSPETDPKIPSGYQLGSVKKMTKAEAARISGDPDAAGGDWGVGDFHAVVYRPSPYALFGG